MPQYIFGALISSCDKVKDFLCKGDYYSACKGQETVSSLRRIVRFKRKTNLNYAEAEQDKTYRTDKSENKVRQIADYIKRTMLTPLDATSAAFTAIGMAE